MKDINIHEFRLNGSKIFSGRDNGISARKKVDLNHKDMDGEQYCVIVPEDTYSISGSFFGGMFSDSVIKLKEDGFRKKYHFQYADRELDEPLREDIEEGIYDALNDL